MVKTAELSRILGRDERNRIIKNIAQLDRPSFVVRALYEYLQSDPNQDEDVKTWITDLRDLEDRMHGRLQ